MNNNINFLTVAGRSRLGKRSYSTGNDNNNDDDNDN